MATDNTIKNFTATDIEKYHKGLLSSKEMHDLEKAALDDPFLADALEGYAVAGVNAGADIAELKKRLNKKVEGAKVIPLVSERKDNFRLLKVAAMIVFVAGASFLIYQFGFNKKADQIAQNEPITTEEKITDTAGSATTNQPASGIESNGLDNTSPEKPNNIEDITPGTTSTGSNKVTTIDRDEITISANNETVSASTKVIPAPVLKNDDKISGGKDAEKRALAKEDATKTLDGYSNQKTADIETKGKSTERGIADMSTNRPVVASKKVDEQKHLNQSSKVFRGRVTDENNVGVPFANVTNLEENAGTYTDARGYFNLTYPDSVLIVQVRSIGFENNNVQLRNSVPTNQVILQDDRSSLSEVVISNKKPNLEARSNNNTMLLEEPEPTDGWTYYDNYLLNNLQLPEEYKSKPIATNEVQVSFEVNKNGEPVNFKIVKSLCNSCDKEAIRLIKDGPKWRRKAKNGRTTVTIPF